LLVVLHARKSAVALESFHEQYPERPILLLLTGSDLYADLLRPGLEAQTVLRGLRCASALIVAQESSLQDIPDEFRSKARVVPKSLDMEVPARAVHDFIEEFHIVLASHLRPAKAPLLVLESLPLLPADFPIRVWHCGVGEDDSIAAAAEEGTKRWQPHYQWLGALSREETLARLAQADLCLNTSRVEGGANSLCEAIQIGVPCVASDIVPNVGMLGEEHPGLFPMDDAKALAGQLQRAATDPVYLETLREFTVKRAPLFTRGVERAAWKAVTDDALAGDL
jgi:glycosyltransferase involved in cell wall biosynthesis